MNIESVTTNSPPQRPPEVQGQVARASTTSAKAAELASSQRQQRVESKDQVSENTQKLSVEDAVKRLADFVAPTNSEINFSIDEESGVRVVKVLDSQSKEVIRQFPSEEAIQLAMALDKLQGLFVKDKA